MALFIQRIKTFTLKLEASGNEGQSLLEFILLLLVLMLLSKILLFTLGHSITGFWRAFIIIVSYPSSDLDNIKFE